MPPLALDSTPLPVVLAVVVAWLGAYVALDFSRRLVTGRVRAPMRWLAAVALALGTTIWSTPVLLLSSLPVHAPLGFDPTLAALAWALATTLAGFVWWPTSRGGGVALRTILSAGLLAPCMAAVLLTVVWGLGLRPTPTWHTLELLLAVGVAAALALPALVLHVMTPQRDGLLARWPWLVQAVASVPLGLALVAVPMLGLRALALPDDVFSAYDRRLPLQTLTVLASVGTIALLLMMLASSVQDARMRRTLRDARLKLQRQSLTDPLTELPNRLMFESALGQAAREADDRQQRLALLSIDLDAFKAINDSYGHRTGDRLLREAASRLRSASREQDMLARLGGDEFLVLMRGDPTRDEAARAAASLQELLAQPWRSEGRELPLTCSIGIVMYPEHGAITTLIPHAEAAVRAAKTTGGATYCFFEGRMASDTREQVELLRDLRQALARGEMELYYQPKVYAPTGEITGAEALMRWHHPSRGMVSPAQFIPLAERFGLITQLGNWVIDEACRQIHAWREGGLRMRVAINLSALQFQQADLPQRVGAALKKWNVHPELLTCEVTESVAMADADTAVRIFGALAAVGVRISIDDFGTGYSSLSYLRKLPVGELKIDRGFVLDLETSADARAVVDAVVKLAQALGLKVVAEGVENEAQGQILRSMGCDELQGYIYAKPMSAKALALWAMDDIGPRAMDFRPSLFGDTMPQQLH